MLHFTPGKQNGASIAWVRILISFQKIVQENECHRLSLPMSWWNVITDTRIVYRDSMTSYSFSCTTSYYLLSYPPPPSPYSYASLLLFLIRTNYATEKSLIMIANWPKLGVRNWAQFPFLAMCQNFEVALIIADGNRQVLDFNIFREFYTLWKKVYISKSLYILVTIFESWCNNTGDRAFPLLQNRVYFHSISAQTIKAYTCVFTYIRLNLSTSWIFPLVWLEITRNLAFDESHIHR